MATVNDFCPFGEIAGEHPEQATRPNSMRSKLDNADYAKVVLEAPLDFTK